MHFHVGVLAVPCVQHVCYHDSLLPCAELRAHDDQHVGVGRLRHTVHQLRG